MRGWFAFLIVGLVAIAPGARAAPRRPVTVFLDRNGRTVSNSVRIPRFGGGDRAWNWIVGCVREHYAPFEVDIVDHKPAHGDFITAVIGGRASQLGLDDRSTNGVGPHTGRVIPNAVVFIFSRVGTGERDVENLCAVTAHEVAHSLGLDHSYECGDIMSYFLDQCGTRRFVDADAPCGEDEPRRCAGGKRTQNSYRRLGELVGFRDGAPPRVREPDDDGWTEPADDGWTDEDSDDGWSTDDTDDDADASPAPIDPYEDEPAMTRASRAPRHPCGGHRRARR